MQKKNYYKEAFNEIFNIIFLVLIALSVLTPLKWLAIAGIVIEILYMAVIPNTRYYRNYIDFKYGTTGKVSTITGKKRHEELKELPHNIRTKCEALEKRHKEILNHVERKTQIKDYISQDLEKLNYLLDSYIDFSVRLAAYRNYLLNNNEALIKEEIKNLRTRIENVFHNVSDNNNLDLVHKRMQKKNLLQNNLTIVQKRLSKINQMKGVTETLQAQLDVIEDTFYLISDHIVSFHPGETLNINVDSIVGNIESTEKILNETFDEINKIKNMQMNRIPE